MGTTTSPQVFSKNVSYLWWLKLAQHPRPLREQNAFWGTLRLTQSHISFPRPLLSPPLTHCHMAPIQRCVILHMTFLILLINLSYVTPVRRVGNWSFSVHSGLLYCVKARTGEVMVKSIRLSPPQTSRGGVCMCVCACVCVCMCVCIYATHLVVGNTMSLLWFPVTTWRCVRDLWSETLICSSYDLPLMDRHTSTHTHSLSHSYTQTHTHSCTHSCSHSHTQSHTHTHTHTKC